MTIAEIAEIGIIAAAFGTVFWDAVKIGYRLAVAWLIPCQTWGNEAAPRLISDYLNAKAKQLGTGPRVWSAEAKYVRREKRKRLLMHHGVSQTDAAWLLGRRPIWNTYSAQDGRRGFRFLRWTVDWERLLKDAEEWHARGARDYREPTGYQVIRVSGKGVSAAGYGGGGFVETWASPSNKANPSPSSPYDLNDFVPLSFAPDELGAPNPDSPFALYAESESTKRIATDFKFRRDSRSWYKNRDIAWRRGYLLQGAPGTGKTSLVRAIAQEAGCKLFIWDLGSFRNEEFLERLRCITGELEDGCVFLFEDIDCVFHGRENVSKGGGGLTLDCLLNALDGVEATEGVALFVTTNHPEHIDPAMTRAGRIDVTVELSGLTDEAREFIARRILDDGCEADAVIAAGAVDATPAAFKSRCIARALELKWGGVAA